MRTPAQRGRYGRWLVSAREARNFDTADKALTALLAAGIKIGKSTYAEYESGSKVPSRNHLPKLEQFWGPVPDEESLGSSATDVAAAIDRQTRAIGELVGRLDLMLAAQSTASVELMRAIGAVASGRVPEGTPVASEREAPAGTGR